MRIRTWSDLHVFFKFWKMYYTSLLRWHLHLTKHKIGNGRCRGQHWSFSSTGYQNRSIWGKEKWDNVVRYYREPGKIEMVSEYTTKSEGSVGNGDYELVLPKGSVINKDGTITLPTSGWNTKNSTKN